MPVVVAIEKDGSRARPSVAIFSKSAPRLRPRPPVMVVETEYCLENVAAPD